MIRNSKGGEKCSFSLLIPHLQKILASDWLFSSVFFFNSRTIN